SGFPIGTVAGGTITWPTITQLLPNDSVIYKFIVKIKTPCPAFSTTNTATAKATNEPLSTANATTLITGTGCVLSIAPMEFKAQAFANGKAILTWNTTNDQDWQGYDIERSTDGIHFENIGTVASLHLSTPYSYTFPTQIEVGTTYFRLKYSIQGVILYSPVVALQRSDLSTVYLAPNPSSHQTRVVGLPLDLGETLVEAFTMEGQKVYSHSDIPQEGQFNVNAQLIPGVYFLKVHALHDVKTFKLVIE
ncbi:MAG: T9SS type A sorting domain-containing protein, partial [Cytophagales bacterium]|nr:T9SS type A sorting domain-containing protein [Cytophagales bacterium]